MIQKFIRSYMGERGGLHQTEYGTRAVEFGEVRLLGADGIPGETFETGGALTVEIPYVAHRRVEKPVFGYSLKTANGLYVFGTNTQVQQHPIPSIEGEGVIRLDFSPLRLMHGNYFLSLSIHSWDHAEQFHRREDWWPFAVRNPTDSLGMIQLDSRWSH